MDSFDRIGEQQNRTLNTPSSSAVTFTEKDCQYRHISRWKNPTPTQEPDTNTGSTINMSFLLVCLLISVHHIKKTHSLQRRNPQLRNGMPRPILRKLLLEDRRSVYFNLNKFLSILDPTEHAKSPFEEHQMLDFLSPWPKFVGDPASHHPHPLENIRSEIQSLKILWDSVWSYEFMSDPLVWQHEDPLKGQNCLALHTSHCKKQTGKTRKHSRSLSYASRTVCVQKKDELILQVT